MSTAENHVPGKDAWRRRLLVFIPLLAFLALPGRADLVA